MQYTTRDQVVPEGMAYSADHRVKRKSTPSSGEALTPFLRSSRWTGIDGRRTLLVIAPHEAVTAPIRAQFAGF